MGIINTDFTMPGQDMPPQNFRDLKTQQGQINWLAQFLMSVNNVFDNVSGSVTTLAEDQSAYVEITFDDENNTATFDFYLPRGYRGYPGSMESVTATASTLAPGSSATVSVTLDQPTQSLAFSFGLPEGTPATDAQTASAVAAWIEAHPEAVTTVQDGAVSTVKLADGAVTFAKLASDVKAILAGKADLVSYAPLLTAGVAESLLSIDEQRATFARRVSEGTSIGVRALLGNTVVWNQMASGVDVFTPNGSATYTVSDNVGTFTASTAGERIQTVFRNAKQGHIYLSKVQIKGSQNGGSNIQMQMSEGTASITTSTEWKELGAISNRQGTSGTIYYPRIYDYSSSEPILIKQLMIFDLTLMFGEGNEPSTIVEFDALFPEDYYPYDAGSWLSVNIEGVNDRAIPASTYFPNGMNGITGDRFAAYDVQDELSRTKAVHNVGIVKASDLTWVMPVQGVFSCTGASKVENMPNKYRVALSFGAYIHRGSDNSSSNVAAYSYPDGVWNYWNASAPTYNGIFVKDTGYSDVASFLAAHGNDYLVYELATPTTEDIDPPINMDYVTQQGGTEQIAIPEGEQSAAPTFVYVQGYDANGIADKALSVIAAVEGDTASTNYAIGSFFIHAGKLYKATSAIASGETITPGTNCTQTTVMAEILALS